MDLCIDIGNTNINIGLFKQEELIFLKNILTVDIHLSEKWADIFSYDIKNVMVSSVVSVKTKKIIDLIRKNLNMEPEFITPDYDFGFKIDYDLSLIGVDRLLAVYGAKKILNNKNLIVVDFGSAITIDVLEDNCFIGGIIFPGVRLLYEGVEKLLGKNKLVSVTNYLKLVTNTNLLGKNTQQAVDAGIYYGIIGLVDYYVKKYKNKDFKVVGTGGDCELFKGVVEFDYVDKSLVLKGMNGLRKSVSF